MGYCFDGEDQFDVFFSYAHADDKAHNHWVRDFERYLTEMVQAELKRRSRADHDRAGQFRLCRDETGFPAGGGLEEVICERVRNSQYLFVFLGSAYLNSEWCLSELEAFRRNTDGTVSSTLKRLFLVVLDRDALNNLRDDIRPTTLSAPRLRLWKELTGVSKQALRVEDFLTENNLLPVYQELGRADPRFHAACQRVTDDLVTRLIQCRAQMQIELPARVERPPHSIVIGGVPERLSAARDELARLLGSSNVRLISDAELADPSLMRRSIEGASVMLQPFDCGYPIGWSPFAPGGHLAYQRQLFEEARSDGQVSLDAKLIWWEPKDAPGADKHMEAKDRAFLDEIDSLPAEYRRVCTAAELAKEFEGRANDAVRTARVWVEWEPSDSEAIEQATKKVREHFDAYCAKQATRGVNLNAALKFGKADWETLQHGLKDTSGKKKPLGVVIVYSEHKDLDALNEQGDCISDIEDVLMKKMFPGVFCMRPKVFYQPTDDWSFVRFTPSQRELVYDPGELEQFVGNLFNVLSKQCPLQGLQDGL